MTKFRTLPQVIPYQGSKRRIVGDLLELIPKGEYSLLHEPFCGSAAVSIHTLYHGLVQQVHLADKLPPLIDLWRFILSDVETLVSNYSRIWLRQFDDDPIKYFYQVRSKYNLDGDPAKLLFLIARCVSNAIRFNAQGEFNQSPDKRRTGTKPDAMAKNLRIASTLLKGKATAECVDFYDAATTYKENELVYLDPPYQGTSGNRDQRYAFSLDLERFMSSLETLISKNVPFILSFDGRLGSKTYGRPLTEFLPLQHLEIVAGRSTQSTLSGGNDLSVESIYLSPNFAVDHGKLSKIVRVS